MNKIGIHYAYFGNMWKADFEERIKLAAKLGFDVLEITTESLLEMSDEKLMRIKQTADDNGIELSYCVAFSDETDMASENENARKNGVEFSIANMKLLKKMGGKNFAGITYGAWNPTINGLVFDKRPFFERSIECVKKVLPYAEEYDINFCVEVVNRFEQFMINTAKEGLDFIAELGSEKAFLLLDTFHMNIEEDSLTQPILDAGKKLGHFHIGEANRRVPGAGRLPWDDIFGALKKINYEGRIVMEPFVLAGGDVSKSVSLWRDLSEGKSFEDLCNDAKGSLEFVKSKLA